MVDWNKTFKAEYDYARGFLADELSFAEEWRPLVRDLYKLMDPEGFDPGRASALTDLRKGYCRATARCWVTRKSAKTGAS